MLDFKIIRNALEDNFKKMCDENANLFEVDLDKDVLLLHHVKFGA